MLRGGIGYCFGQAHFGARLAAMANSGNAVKDVWNIQGNPAGITGLHAITAALDYTKYLFAPQLSRQALALAIPLKNSYVGLGLDRYGIAEYSEIKVSMALIRKFGKQLAIGLKGNYHQLKISNYGATTAFSLDVGLLYNWNENLIVGFYISNPAQQKYKTTALGLVIPTTIQLGLSYALSDKILIATNVSKALKIQIDAAIGLEYQLLQLLSLRGGLSAQPFKQYAGFGLNYKKIMLDMAIESDPYLGYSPQITLGYVF